MKSRSSFTELDVASTSRRELEAARGKFTSFRFVKDDSSA